MKRVFINVVAKLPALFAPFQKTGTAHMTSIYVLGEALMDCVATSDGLLHPHVGGSPFNMARAAALRGADVAFLNRFSQDQFGDQMQAQLAKDHVQTVLGSSRLPTSLAVVQVKDGQPSYGFYREGIADRDYSVTEVLQALAGVTPGVLHTGSLMLVPPEHEKVLAVLHGAKAQGWVVSVDVNLRPKLAADLNAYVAAVKEVAALADWIKASDEDLLLLGFTEASKQTSPGIAKTFAAHGATRTEEQAASIGSLDEFARADIDLLRGAEYEWITGIEVAHEHCGGG